MMLNVYISSLCYYDPVDKDKIGKLPSRGSEPPIFSLHFNDLLLLPCEHMFAIISPRTIV